ncbi:hypothetical protein AB0K87_26370, partial [Streptomyces sp. NPDC053705]|uniref:hypothetical protein n=1 Tax=Streptomyces sp. NPDC053705 TaxID=3156668 RepID=UPI00341BB880
EAEAYDFSPMEREFVDGWLKDIVHGTADEVRRRGDPRLAVRLASPLGWGRGLQAHAPGGTEQLVGPRQTHSA